MFRNTFPLIILELFGGFSKWLFFCLLWVLSNKKIIPFNEFYERPKIDSLSGGPVTGLLNIFIGFVVLTILSILVLIILDQSII